MIKNVIQAIGISLLFVSSFSVLAMLILSLITGTLHLVGMLF